MPRAKVGARILIDADVNVEVGHHLQALGLNVVFAHDIEADVTDDRALLRWARRHKRILVCHDRHKDIRTKQFLMPEIYNHGGRILRIGGNPDQHPFLAVGKVLVHYVGWEQFFSASHGICTVHTDSIKKQGPEELYEFVHKRMKLDIDPVAALRERKRLPRRRRPVAPKASMPLL